MSEHAPTDNTQLEALVDRLFDESDRIVIELFSRFVDRMRLEAAE